MIGPPFGGALVTLAGGSLRPPVGLLTARIAAVRLASIASAADEEEPDAEPAAGHPEAALHDSPGERAGNLSLRSGACETGRTSVCRRSRKALVATQGLRLFGALHRRGLYRYPSTWRTFRPLVLALGVTT
jgi:hypothetical protein